MKKYDFTKYELWFSFRALQMLACAERRLFARHIKNVRRKILSEEQDKWNNDEVYLMRNESGRNVRRKAEIFDLFTSYRIMSDFALSAAPNYRAVISRLKDLCAQDESCYVNSLIAELKRQKMPVDYLVKDEYSSEDIGILQLLANGKSIKDRKRRRIVLDARGGVFKIVNEYSGAIRTKRSGKAMGHRSATYR